MEFGQWLTAAAVSQVVGISQDGTVWSTIAFVTFFTVLSVATFGLARRGEARETSRRSVP